MSSTPFTSLPTWILSSAAARSHRVLQARLTASGVSGYEYRCLDALAHEGTLSQADLGHAVSLDPRDVTHTVRSLESRGLVGRTPDPAHGRRLLVTLTPTGRRALRRARRTMTSVQETVFGRLTADERATLVGLLRRVG